MSRILCVAVVLSVLSGPALAGMSEGMAAVTVGDYPKAISEFQPLASSGDAAAQYQLAKIYLEGHGPADGVPQGIDLMTKAANGNYPEAQAQLGLMYAMGLGVGVDNAKAYQWLNKAVNALPDGTRRTVAEANRDAVLKRMNGGTTVATATPAPAPAAASTTATATKTATATTDPAKTKPTTTAMADAAKTKPVATTDATKTQTAAKPTTETTASKPATTDMAKVDPAKTVAPAPAPAKVTETAKIETKPADTTAKPADATKTVANTSAPKTPDASAAPATTQVASAKAPDTDAATASASSGSASAATAPSGVRIQLASLPSEELAWKAWKDLSGKYSSQLTGLTAIVQPADLGTKGTFYRVQTGPFDTVAKAQERCTAMKQAGLDCLVVGRP